METLHPVLVSLYDCLARLFLPVLVEFSLSSVHLIIFVPSSASFINLSPVFSTLTLSLFILASEVIYIGPVKGKLSSVLFPSALLPLPFLSSLASSRHSWSLEVT